jgi:hypothetical protein
VQGELAIELQYRHDEHTDQRADDEADGEAGEEHVSPLKIRLQSPQRQ